MAWKAAVDIANQAFGRWTALNRDTSKTTRESWWICRCSCPKQTTRSVRYSSLMAGTSRSCGCATREAVSEAKATHRMKRTHEYFSWVAMKQRCLNPNHVAYDKYGGRGISICSRWKSFEFFLEDMGRRPSILHTLDRHPNNDGHYSCGKCPECIEKGWSLNCRWGTKAEQARNRSSSHFITLQGETKTLTEWRETGLTILGVIKALTAENEELREIVESLG